jgi:hypothetical protein
VEFKQTAFPIHTGTELSPVFIVSSWVVDYENDRFDRSDSSSIAFTTSRFPNFHEYTIHDIWAEAKPFPTHVCPEERAAHDFIVDLFDVREIDSEISLIIRPSGDYIPLLSMRHPENLFRFCSMEEIFEFNTSLLKFSILFREPVGLFLKNERCHPSQVYLDYESQTLNLNFKY